ncbi:MAG: acylphosphatase [Thermoproteota archaeon]
MVKGYRLVFRGRVQGVGFRWSARVIAARLGLSGYARNLEDGGVEVVVVGDREAVKDLVEKLRSLGTAEVSEVTMEEVELEEEPQGFRVE